MARRVGKYQRGKKLAREKRRRKQMLAKKRKRKE